jgi:hypothetical protein
MIFYIILPPTKITFILKKRISKPLNQATYSRVNLLINSFNWDKNNSSKSIHLFN